jgi:hypothetical protein
MTRLVALLLVVLLAASGPAFADEAAGGSPPASPDDFRAAKRHFNRGIQLFDQGNFPGALAEFESSYRRRPSPTVLYNIGLAQQQLHRYAEAIATLQRYLQLSPSVPPQRAEAVRQLIAAMEPRLARLDILVEPPGATVRIDGRIVGQAPVPTRLLTAGTYVVSAESPGYVAAREEVVATSGQTTAVRLKLVAEVRTGRVRLVVRPSDATLTVDQQVLGRGTASSELRAGGHVLEATAKGYQPHRSELVVAAGQERDVLVELVPVPRRFYQRWWFWTLTAAVVGGVVAGAVVGTRPEPPHGSLPPGLQVVGK